MLVTNIQIREILERLKAVCPNCNKRNVWFTHTVAPGQIIRVCPGCGALLEITIKKESKMEFLIERTSLYDEKPCEEARAEELNKEVKK